MSIFTQVASAEVDIRTLSHQNISNKIQFLELPTDQSHVLYDHTSVLPPLPDLLKVLAASEPNLSLVNTFSVKHYPDTDVVWLKLELNELFAQLRALEKMEEGLAWHLSFSRMRGDHRLRLFQVSQQDSGEQTLTELKEGENGRDSHFKIDDLANSEFYIRAYHFQGRYNFPVILYEQQDLIQSTLLNSVVLAICLGFIFGLALYNLSVFARTKKITYFYYVLYLFSTILVVIFLENLDVLIFQQDWLMLTTTPQISTALAGMFFITFYNTKAHTPIFHKILVIATALSAIMPLMYQFIEYHPLVTLRTVNFFLVFIPVFIVGVIRVKQGFSSAKYILIGWPLPIIGGSLLMVMSTGALPYSVYIGYMYYAGVMIEVVFFALALADQINLLENEKKVLTAEKLVVSQQANQLKDRFLSTISHELRTPLNGTTAALELLGETLQDSSELKIAQRSTKYLTTLINKILVFNDIYADKLSSTTAVVALYPILLEKFSYFRNEATTKDILLSWNMTFHKADLFECDAELIGLINSELLQNAVNFTEEGRINIMCQYHEETQIFRFKITDTGVGLNDIQLQKAFNCLEQIDQSLTRDVDGLGLGLTLVNTLVDHLGGQLSVTSTQGVGSSFEYSIPMVRKESPVLAPMVSGERALVGEEKRALIVEDQKTNQIILTKFLEKLGFNVDVANNGQVGVAHCEKNVYDIIFMDLQMPVMDGFEACEHIRQEGMNQATPIVVVSANASSVEVEHCKEVGVNDFLNKPIALKIIKTACQQQLQ